MSFLSASVSFSFLLLLISYSWGCDPGDRAALLDFSNALDSPVPVWLLANESVHTDCCHWIGVTCSSSRSKFPPPSKRVVKLDLHNNRLSGRVSGSLERLDQLKFIDLSMNNLSGSIPDELFRPRSLEMIYLSRNLFSGPLSSAFGNLRSLMVLHVSSNSLSGSFPDAFGQLRNLTYLSVGLNNLNGSLPPSLSSCSQLQFLDVSANNFSRQLNLNFTALSELDVLLLDHNHFTGRIPQSISSCRKLRLLTLAGNNLHGQIPQELFSPSLRALFLGGNNLSNITRALLSLKRCQNLTILDLSGNFKNEEMPQHDGIAFPNLKTLNIAGSKLCGTFPAWLSKSEKLLRLDFSRNFLTGEIPMFLTQLKSLSGFKEQNDFVHPVRIGTANYSVIFNTKPVLDLGSNLLSGNTWIQLSKLRQLYKLNLSHNYFTGFIPSDFSKMRSLEILDLSSNLISGTIPSSLQQLTYLSFFCVANNNLHGDVPTGSQFLTFPSTCFDGNLGLCYFGKPGCHSPSPFASKKYVQNEETYKLIDTGLPLAIGVSVGYATTFFTCGLHLCCMRSKQILKYKRRH